MLISRYFLALAMAILSCLDVAHAQEMPSTVGSSWNWLGPNAWNTYGWAFEDNNAWENEIKPTISAALAEHLSNISVRNRPQRRHAVPQQVFIPAWVVSSARLSAIVHRFFEIAQEFDVPLIFKVTGLVWWDYSGCPACGTTFSFQNDIEWWGWAQGTTADPQHYVWAESSTPSHRFTWRAWGNVFEITIPHPYLTRWFIVTGRKQNFAYSQKPSLRNTKRLEAKAKVICFGV
ncbi:MAG: hypothetical protein IPJ88_02115 [Myxococcales bacterium]|nr:MAG: hypothetical protein IPJ88_02115 [Myxococcales bacterium]